MCGPCFGGGADEGWCEVGEGKGLDCVVQRTCNFDVVLGGDVERDVEEWLAVGFDEGGEAVHVRSLVHAGTGKTDAIQSALSCSGNPTSITHSPAEYCAI